MAQDVLLRLPAVRTDWPDNGPSASRLGLSQNIACSWSLRCNSDGTTLCTTLDSDNMQMGFGGMFGCWDEY